MLKITWGQFEEGEGGLLRGCYKGKLEGGGAISIAWDRGKAGKLKLGIKHRLEQELKSSEEV